MKLVRQPRDSNLCGQACVATVAGITLEESIAIFRKRGKTSTCHLREALKHCGFDPYHGATRMCKASAWIGRLWNSATLIVKFTRGKDKHWVVRHKGKFYDPAAGVFRETPEYLKTARATSFLIVNKTEALSA